MAEEINSSNTNEETKDSKRQSSLALYSLKFAILSVILVIIASSAVSGNRYSDIIMEVLIIISLVSSTLLGSIAIGIINNSNKQLTGTGKAVAAVVISILLWFMIFRSY